MTDSAPPKSNDNAPAASGSQGVESGEKRKRRRRRRGGGGAHADQGGEGAEGAQAQARGPRPDQRSDQRPGQRQDQRPGAQRQPGQQPQRGEQRSDRGGNHPRPPQPNRPQQERRTQLPRASMPAPQAAPGLVDAAAFADADVALDDMGMSIPPPTEVWGIDDEPLIDVVLGANLPPEDGAYVMTKQGVVGDAGVRSVARVTFPSAGRTMVVDAPPSLALAALPTGAEVTVAFERGPRVGVLRSDTTRIVSREKAPGAIIGPATADDRQKEATRLAEMTQLLATAKEIAKQLRLAGKVYRVEGQPKQKLIVYYTSDERLDMREFSHRYGAKTGARIELRQLGVRDEAKAVGGIGSCGLPLCCTTWLPDFVPVSIKMAKDQGLVLTSNKVSGQCGRLKCCLVYEQAGYTEMRKGLPRLGKRVTTAVGEGRVIEVDVLRQRIRVAYGPGETQVHPANEVTPKFPSQQQPQGGSDKRRNRRPSQEVSQLAHLGELPDGADDDDQDDDVDDPSEQATANLPEADDDSPREPSDQDH